MSAPTPVTNYEYTLYSGDVDIEVPSYLTPTCDDAVYTNSYTSSPDLASAITFDD